MNPTRNLLARLTGLAFASFVSSANAEVPAPALSAQDLASRLSARRQDGSSYVRLRMEIKPAAGPKTVLQLHVKSRRERSTDVVYQVLWPKERKGESVLLRKAGDRSPSGTLFVPPDAMRPLTSAQMKDPLFGSDLSYGDALEDFFSWDRQSLDGSEVVDGVSCQILESKPGKGESSPYARVRSWIDTRRLVPLRVEKYSASGQLSRRIDTTRIVKDDDGDYIPAALMVRRAGQDSITELEGTRSKRDAAYADSEFTPEALRQVTTPRSALE